jgi:c-di-GMP-binding flagellar brake protein YcgR
MKKLERQYNRVIKMFQNSNNLLKKNYKDWAIFSIINNAKLNKKTVVGWKMIAGQKVRVEVIFHIIRKFRNEIVVNAFYPKNKLELKKLASGSEKLNFYLPDEMVLFQTEVKQIKESGDIIIGFPTMIAQVERRKDFRLFLENNLNIEVSFTKNNHGQKVATQPFKKNCFDISSGGLTFIVSKTEKTFFRLGDEIENVTILIEERLIEVKAEILKIDKIEPNERNTLIYGGWLVGAKLSKISKADKEYIDDYVFKYTEFEEVI